MSVPIMIGIVLAVVITSIMNDHMKKEAAKKISFMKKEDIPKIIEADKQKLKEITNNIEPVINVEQKKEE